MRKSFLFISIVLCIIFISCGSSTTQNQVQTTQTQDETTNVVNQSTTIVDHYQELPFIDKLEISNDFISHLDAEPYQRILYISDDLLVYVFPSQDTIGESIIKIVKDDGVESFSIGRNSIYDYIGYDSEYNSVYYTSRVDFPFSECVGDATDDEEIDYQLPVEFMTTTFFGSEEGVYDFLGNSYHQELDYEKIVWFSYYPGDDMIFYSYIYGQSTIQGYNLTKNEIFDEITLKDNLKFDEIIYTSKDLAIIGTKYGGFISIDKENNISYFLREEHSIPGYNGLNEGLANNKYPYFEFNEIDGSNDLYVVADPNLLNFITVDDYQKVQYIDENIHVLLEDDSYNFYNGDTVVHSVVKTSTSTRLFFSNYADKLIYTDYGTSSITVYDTTNNQIIKTIDGTQRFRADNIFAYTSTTNANQLVLFDMDSNSEKIVDINNLTEKSTFYINNEYFILYDNSEVTLYNMDTLENESFEFVSALSRTDATGRVIVYGLLVEKEGRYYLIG